MGPDFRWSPGSEIDEDSLAFHAHSNQLRDYDPPGDKAALDILSIRRDSGPGPDWLRYAILAATGSPVYASLTKYFSDAWRGSPPAEADQSGATCFTPKAFDERHQVLAEDTRPITLMSVTYKVAAAISNKHLASPPPTSDDRPKGFVKGRPGIERVIDLDTAAHSLALRGATPLQCSSSTSRPPSPVCHTPS